MGSRPRAPCDATWPPLVGRDRRQPPVVISRPPPPLNLFRFREPVTRLHAIGRNRLASWARPVNPPSFARRHNDRLADSAILPDDRNMSTAKTAGLATDFREVGTQPGLLMSTRLRRRAGRDNTDRPAYGTGISARNSCANHLRAAPRQTMFSAKIIRRRRSHLPGIPITIAESQASRRGSTDSSRLIIDVPWISRMTACE